MIITHTHSSTNALVVCNGEFGMTKKEFLPLVNDAPFIVCADGGANKMRRWKIRPHLIIGDMDSLIPLTKRVYSDVEMLTIPDQNTTDLEKVFEYLVNHNYTHVVVASATGNRIDHTLATIGTVLKYGTNMDIVIKDALFDMFFVKSARTIETKPGQRISLMPFGVCAGVTTEGLRYPLAHGTMEFGVRDGISNEAVGDVVTVTVTVGEGSVLMMVQR